MWEKVIKQMKKGNLFKWTPLVTDRVKIPIGVVA